MFELKRKWCKNKTVFDRYCNKGSGCFTINSLDWLTVDNEVSPSAEEDAEDTDSAESENNEDDPRNKRFLNLGGGSGSSGGGSGNFLFDIIRVSMTIDTF